jgi:hypothetical protein
MAKPLQTPLLFYGQPFYKVEKHYGVHLLEHSLNESNIQVGGCFAPCGLASPWEILKDIKIGKLGNSNLLAKTTKFISISTNAKLDSHFNSLT